MAVSTLERHIVELLKEGDQRAIPLIYEHYADALLGVIQQIIKDESLSHDVLQDALVKIWKYAQKYDAKKAKLFTWLYRIARNTAIDQLRAMSKTQGKNIQIDNDNVYKLPVFSISHDAMDLRAHLATLEEKYQIVLKALYFEGMTQQEASDELNIPLGTVKSRLKIGLRELKKIYVS